MSPAARTLETMFENAAGAKAERIDALRDRIRGMERTKLDTRALATSEALAPLLPGGALMAGGSYAVDGSTALALELLRMPSSTGAWCAVVGMPDLGVEACAAAGLDLERLLVIPRPAEQWLAIVSALIDAVQVVLVQPPPRACVGEAAMSRLASRLRQREAVLIVAGEWPRAQARLSIAESDWVGIGDGFGHVAARRATVASRSPSWQGRSRSQRLWLPDARGSVTPVAPVVAVPRAFGAADETPTVPLRALAHA